MQVLRTDYKGRGKYRAMAIALNTIGRVINGMTGEGGTEIYAAGDEIRFRVEAGGGGTTFLFPWRISSSAAAILTVSGGYAIHGTSDPVSVPATEVEVSGGTFASPHWIVFQFKYQTRLASIVPVSVAAAPRSDPEYFRCGLHRAYLSESGSAVLVSQRQFSDIIVPGFA